MEGENIFNKAIGFVKEKPIIAAGVGLAILLLFGRKLFRAPRRRRRYQNPPASVPYTRRRRVKRLYNKAGRRLKAWQIKGSLAARRHMARIRKLR